MLGLVGATYGGVQTLSAAERGDPYATLSNGIGAALGVGAIFAGPVGLAAEGAYFLLDSFVGVDRIFRADAEFRARMIRECGGGPGCWAAAGTPIY